MSERLRVAYEEQVELERVKRVGRRNARHTCRMRLAGEKFRKKRGWDLVEEDIVLDEELDLFSGIC